MSANVKSGYAQGFDFDLNQYPFLAEVDWSYCHFDFGGYGQEMVFNFKEVPNSNLWAQLAMVRTKEGDYHYAIRLKVKNTPDNNIAVFNAESHIFETFEYLNLERSESKRMLATQTVAGLNSSGLIDLVVDYSTNPSRPVMIPMIGPQTIPEVVIVGHHGAYQWNWTDGPSFGGVFDFLPWPGGFGFGGGSSKGKPTKDPDPCAKMKAWLSDPVVQFQLNALMTAASGPVESGFTYDGTNAYEFLGYANYIIANLPPNVKVYGHSHTQSGYGTFSPQDIRETIIRAAGLENGVPGVNDPLGLTFFVVTPQGGISVIKIEDMTKLSAFSQTLNNSANDLLQGAYDGLLTGPGSDATDKLALILNSMNSGLRIAKVKSNNTKIDCK